jgi:hypothetical protein
MIYPRVVTEGSKNLVVTVSATLSGELPRVTILSFGDLSPCPKAIKFENVVYSFQKDLGLFFSWEGIKDEKLAFIMPLEGRGYLNVEGTGGIMSPPEATGIEIASYGYSTKAAAFYFTLDLAKH